MDDLPSKSWYCWPVVQFENEAHSKNIRCFKEQEMAIWPQRHNFFQSIFFFFQSIGAFSLCFIILCSSMKITEL